MQYSFNFALYRTVSRSHGYPTSNFIFAFIPFIVKSQGLSGLKDQFLTHVCTTVNKFNKGNVDTTIKIVMELFSP